jgi:hypothetical protein
MTKIQNPELPPEAGQPDPHSSLDCYQLTLLAIPPPQYIVIVAIFFRIYMLITIASYGHITGIWPVGPSWFIVVHKLILIGVIGFDVTMIPLFVDHEVRKKRSLVWFQRLPIPGFVA